MRKSPSEKTTRKVKSAPRQDFTVLAVLTDMADTTWRVFVPTVSLLLIGRNFDVRWGTKPWLMLAGATLGALVAWRLIVRQLNQGSTLNDDV